LRLLKHINPSCFFLLLVLLILPEQSYAGHIVGGEFTYSCRGWQNNDPGTGIRVYDVRINVYRDCIGQGAYFDGVSAGNGSGPDGNASAPGHISIYRGTTLVEATLSILLNSADDVPVNLGNPCLVLTEAVCQQVGVYEFTIELPVSTEPYTLTYQRCCRNEAIINLVTPDEIGTTYFITITPEAQLNCNASPVFNIDPPIAICANEQFQINMGATDRENDSLVYKLCDPVVGGGRDGLQGTMTATTFDDVVPLIESPPPYTNAAFRSPQFSVNDQLGIGSTLTVDPRTGDLSGVPIFRGTFALAVCIEEWSQDSVPILLSETKREFQLTVNLCGNQVRADLLETELDDQGRFFIRQCGVGENTIINESTNVAFINEYDWTLDGPDGVINGTSRDFITNITTVGTYTGQMILNRSTFAENCRDTADFLLGVFPGIEPDFEFSVPGCDDVSIDFTDASMPLGANTITDWDWDFADMTSIDNRQNPRHRYTIPGDFGIRLTITDNNNCSANTVKQLEYFPSPRTILIEPDEGFGCAPFAKEFINLSRPIDDTYLYEWDFGDGGTGDEASPTHVYENSGVYDVYLGITSPTGCFVDTTFVNLVDVRDAPVADFTWTPEEPSNIFPDIRILDQSTGAVFWRYTITTRSGDPLFSTNATDFDYSLTTRDTGTVFINQLVTHPSGCIDTITKSVKLKLINTYFMPDVFTPNGDGLNDVFLPVGLLAGVSDYQLRVWTRWGERVFTSLEVRDGWDGTFNGRDSPGGGYLWDAKYTDINGEPVEFKGGVVLLR